MTTPNERLSKALGNEKEAGDLAAIISAMKNGANGELVEELYLQDRDIGDDGLEKLCRFISQMEEIRKLDLTGNQIAGGFEVFCKDHLHRLAKLRTLVLSNNGLGGKGFMKLLVSCVEKCPLLEELTLDANALGDPGVQVLLASKELRKRVVQLDLGNTGISSWDRKKGALKDLNRWEKLERLSLYRNKPARFDGVGAMFQACKRLVCLDISENDLGDEVAQNVVKSFSNSNSLKELYLASIGITATFFDQEVLSVLGKLTVLDLEGNDLTPHAMELLATADFSRLETLKLASNPIENKGAKTILQTLKSSNFLNEIDLSRTKLSSEGRSDLREVGSIVTLLKSLSSLVTVKLAGNRLGKTAVPKLTRLLTHCTMLRKLALYGNQFDIEAGSRLIEGIQEWKLSRLSIGNKINIEKDKDRLQELVGANWSIRDCQNGNVKLVKEDYAYPSADMSQLTSLTCTTVYLVGDPGAGKTNLMNELLLCKGALETSRTDMYNTFHVHLRRDEMFVSSRITGEVKRGKKPGGNDVKTIEPDVDDVPDAHDSLEGIDISPSRSGVTSPDGLSVVATPTSSVLPEIHPDTADGRLSVLGTPTSSIFTDNPLPSTSGRLSVLATPTSSILPEIPPDSAGGRCVTEGYRLTVVDCGGEDLYQDVYRHRIINGSIIVIVVDISQSPAIIKATVDYWLAFIYTRISELEADSRKALMKRVFTIVVAFSHVDSMSSTDRDGKVASAKSALDSVRKTWGGKSGKFSTLKEAHVELKPLLILDYGQHGRKKIFDDLFDAVGAHVKRQAGELHRADKQLTGSSDNVQTVSSLLDFCDRVQILLHEKVHRYFHHDFSKREALFAVAGDAFGLFDLFPSRNWDSSEQNGFLGYLMKPATSGNLFRRLITNPYRMTDHLWLYSMWVISKELSSTIQLGVVSGLHAHIQGIQESIISGGDQYGVNECAIHMYDSVIDAYSLLQYLPPTTVSDSLLSGLKSALDALKPKVRGDDDLEPSQESPSFPGLLNFLAEPRDELLGHPEPMSTIDDSASDSSSGHPVRAESLSSWNIVSSVRKFLRQKENSDAGVRAFLEYSSEMERSSLGSISNGLVPFHVLSCLLGRPWSDEIPTSAAMDGTMEFPYPHVLQGHVLPPLDPDMGCKDVLNILDAAGVAYAIRNTNASNHGPHGFLFIPALLEHGTVVPDTSYPLLFITKLEVDLVSWHRVLTALLRCAYGFTNNKEQVSWSHIRVARHMCVASFDYTLKPKDGPCARVDFQLLWGRQYSQSSDGSGRGWTGTSTMVLYASIESLRQKPSNFFKSSQEPESSGLPEPLKSVVGACVLRPDGVQMVEMEWTPMYGFPTSSSATKRVIREIDSYPAMSKKKRPRRGKHVQEPASDVLCELHTHLMGMGSNHFWVYWIMGTFLDSIYNQFPRSPHEDCGTTISDILDFLGDSSTFPEEYRDFSVYYPFKRTASTIGGGTQEDFVVVHLNRRSATRKEMINIWKEDWSSKTFDDRDQRIKYEKQCLLQRLCANFTTDIVYPVDMLVTAIFGVDENESAHPETSKASAAAFDSLYRLESVLSNPNSVMRFRDYCRNYTIYNYKKNSFETVFGVPNQYLLDAMEYGVNSPTSDGKAVRAVVENCFSMLNRDGSDPCIADLLEYRGCFTPKFYPMRFHIKDCIYEQYPYALSVLLENCCRRFRDANVKYIEFSASPSDLLNVRMQPVLTPKAVWCTSAWRQHAPWLERRVLNVAPVIYRFLLAFPRTVAVYPDINKCLDPKNDFFSKGERFRANEDSMFSWLNKEFQTRGRMERRVFVAKIGPRYLKESSDWKVRFIGYIYYKVIRKFLKAVFDAAGYPQEEQLKYSQWTDVLELEKIYSKLIDPRHSTYNPFFKLVVGLDVVSDEDGTPFSPFTHPVFTSLLSVFRTHNERFGVRLHGGESVWRGSAVESYDPVRKRVSDIGLRNVAMHLSIIYSDLQALKDLQGNHSQPALRIGHGVAFTADVPRAKMIDVGDKVGGYSGDFRESCELPMSDIRDFIRKNKIPLELNLTSNFTLLLDGYQRDMCIGPTSVVRRALDLGLPVIFGTDNDGIWPMHKCGAHYRHISVAHEYCKAALHFEIDDQQYRDMVKLALNSRFDSVRLVEDSFKAFMEEGIGISDVGNNENDGPSNNSGSSSGSIKTDMPCTVDHSEASRSAGGEMTLDTTSKGRTAARTGRLDKGKGPLRRS